MQSLARQVFTRQVYWSESTRKGGLQGVFTLIEDAENIMRRENWSFNKLMFEALAAYVKKHKEGNVSFQLDQFGITWQKARSVDKCADCGSPDVVVIGITEKEALPLCNKDFEKRRHRLRGYREVSESEHAKKSAKAR